MLGKSPPLPDRRAAIARHIAALERLAHPASRHDGWTAFARRVFLQAVAQSGRVKSACQRAGMSKQSAYALRARDHLFAAGWDAACELARIPLAEKLYAQATSPRPDNRLSMAVLNRLDQRCDRAVDSGSLHLHALGQWDEFLTAVCDDDRGAAQAILDASIAAAERERILHTQQGQASQLRAAERRAADDLKRDSFFATLNADLAEEAEPNPRVKSSRRPSLSSAVPQIAVGKAVRGPMILRSAILTFSQWSRSWRAKQRRS